VIGDREISGFRRGYYELLSQLFLEAPKEALTEVLHRDLEGRIEAAQNLNPSLATGWRAVGSYLSEHTGDTTRLCEALAEEHTLLFISPWGPVVFPYESYYMERELLGPSLAEVRGFLRRAGLEKREGFTEPEDHIACELEVMAQLIARQEVANDPTEEERWLHLQGEFFRTHLLPWAFLLCDEVEKREKVEFYKGVAKLTRGFMELERELMAEWGPAVPPRQPARERVTRWKGPTFGPPEIEGTGGDGS
jgi:TorA maturation chaperone TorD